MVWARLADVAASRDVYDTCDGSKTRAIDSKDVQGLVPFGGRCFGAAERFMARESCQNSDKSSETQWRGVSARLL